jgi:hypothetical protein
VTAPVSRYPGIAEYNQAVQNAAVAFADPDLKTGRLATNALGLPIVLGGGFALTYTVTANGSKTGAQKFAVRCFHRYVPDLEQRYALIAKAIGALRSPHFVAFEYQRDGVQVKAGRFPIVKMAWAEGSTLQSFLEDNYEDAAAIRALADKFRDLARFLASRGIAHGDLEGSNMVVRNGALTLIDYDGMFVPGMATGKGNELGHAHFQHPGRETRHFGPRIDDFSFILLDVSLAALAADKTLYEQFCNGDNILFQKSDFLNPAGSAVFQRLRTIRSIARKVDDFAAICKRPIEKVPSLEEFLAARQPAAAVAPSGAAQAPARPAGTSNLDYVRGALAQRRGPTAAPAPAPATATPRARAPGSPTVVTWIWWAEMVVGAAILFGFLAG